MNKLLKINNIFSKLDIYAKNSKSRIRNINNGLSLTDVVLYKFKCTNINSTKTSACSDINFKNVINGKFKKDRTLFYKKEMHLNLSFYENLRNDIFNMCLDVCEENFNDKFIPINTDGSVTHSKIKKNNKNLELSTNMGYTFSKLNVPLHLTYNGPFRNDEIQNLKNFINGNKLKNLMYVCDRAYFSYDLFNFINEHDSKCIIRIDNDSLLISKNENKINKSKDKLTINNIIKNYRVIKKEYIGYSTIVLKGKQKKTIKKKTSIYLLTNLSDKDKNGNYIYSDNDIIDLYKKRWNVEIFFKFIKNCFKFQEQNGKNNNENQKLNECILILTYICNMITHLYQKKVNLTETIIRKEIEN